MRRCQRSSVSGCTRNSDQRTRGSSRLSAASSARSVGCSLGGGCWRRSTASSWRSTRISISLASTDRKQSRISSADEGSRRGRIAVLRRAVPTGHGHDRLLAPDGPPTGCWRPAAVIESELIGGSAARGGGSELDAVGPLQLLDPVVLDGDAVALGQLVVFLGAGRRGPRPAGRARHHQPGRVQPWAAWWAWPLYRTVIDPDGRPWRLRRAGRF